MNQFKQILSCTWLGIFLQFLSDLIAVTEQYLSRDCKSFLFSGKDIEIALTELRELQNHIDTLMLKDRQSRSEIQELLETKYKLEK